ncbi:hypothetical protein TTHERM_000550699 (macronuclear) [Tetrahymena thermophila SB210]|uniref:Uncharacterized protein n=1 Tax=Tetrahymena thermophila (strain SB210) TaxID=312017 RepID=W7XJY9_TETTS|nr:hypothetical protein TTHERM_000550699 [Tetrahymena thermophila SB210]EWS76066.1 hypothetical protein TTHERM_000550699 [Tetrahymena thermophila SB210]|eukprot:XP_012651373.1 hypothetical protein TTHERM_000550699 [Tetrahymena thermophila SB210]
MKEEIRKEFNFNLSQISYPELDKMKKECLFKQILFYTTIEISQINSEEEAECQKQFYININLFKLMQSLSVSFQFYKISDGTKIFLFFTKQTKQKSFNKKIQIDLKSLRKRGEKYLKTQCWNYFIIIIKIFQFQKNDCSLLQRLLKRRTRIKQLQKMCYSGKKQNQFFADSSP